MDGQSAIQQVFLDDCYQLYLLKFSNKYEYSLVKLRAGIHF